MGARQEERGNFMRLVLLSALLLILTGCSGYSRFYTAQLDDNNLSHLETLKEGQTPIIIKTNDLTREIDRYLTKNFDIIGESSFNGAMESDDNLISQAINVKATHVLQSSSFVTTQGISTPLFMPNGIGGINTTAIYSQQMRYDQAAVFMAKSTRKLRYGFTSRALKNSLTLSL